MNLEPALAQECATIAAELRSHFNVEVYGGDDKIGKQMKYADRAKIPYALLYGTSESAAKVVKVKELHSGVETLVPRAELVAWLTTHART